MQPLQKYYAKGKLLITGEYAVLDGALSLAIPTRFGQWLEVYSAPDLQQIEWKSYDYDHALWFECCLDEHLIILTSNDNSKAQKLRDILQQAILQNPSFKSEILGKKVITKLEFNRKWGLGSSSTLIHTISQWAQIDPYMLLDKTFGGSGYDLACADATGPITYQINNGNRIIQPVDFQLAHTENIHFIYLGQKQFSDQEIAKYSQLSFDRDYLVAQISEITHQVTSTPLTENLETLLLRHERLLSETLGYPTIKEQRFAKFSGLFKSLGAWGGDFVMFMGCQEEINTLRSLGYLTILGWNEMFEN